MNERFFLIVYAIAVAVLGIIFHFSYLISTILFFVPPSIYITIRRPDLFRPIGIYSLAVGIPFVLIIDTIALYNHSWWETSAFPIRIFNLMPFDTVVWSVLYVYTTLVFFEYFFEKGNETPALSRRFWNLEIGLLFVLTAFLFSFSFHPEWFMIPYFYAVFVGIFYIAVSIGALIHIPKAFSTLWIQCLFLSVWLFVAELGALAAHQWGFSGSEYLGMIRIGAFTLPFEEMVWIVTGIPPLVYIYLQLTDRSRLGWGKGSNIL